MPRISIHTPLRERPVYPPLPNRSEYFNPRSLAGATKNRSMATLDTLFQPTLPRGSDSAASLGGLINLVFQPTLPHGSDDAADIRHLSAQHFNPRSLTGATAYRHCQTVHAAISIPAPSRERHGRCCVVACDGWISIHAPSRERPSNTVPSASDNAISIHAPSRERLCA